MGWIIAIVIWVLIIIFSNLFINNEGTKAGDVYMWILITIGVLILLTILGFIWYYFCGGALVFEIPDSSFGDRVGYFVISIFVLMFAITFIAEIFKRF